jgi:hypothetical protein
MQISPFAVLLDGISDRSSSEKILFLISSVLSPGCGKKGCLRFLLKIIISPLPLREG